jgi:hypothetical protein
VIFAPKSADNKKPPKKANSTDVINQQLVSEGARSLTN